MLARPLRRLLLRHRLLGGRPEFRREARLEAIALHLERRLYRDQLGARILVLRVRLACGQQVLLRRRKLAQLTPSHAAPEERLRVVRLELEHLGSARLGRLPRLELNLRGRRVVVQRDEHRLEQLLRLIGGGRVLHRVERLIIRGNGRRIVARLEERVARVLEPRRILQQRLRHRGRELLLLLLGARLLLSFRCLLLWVHGVWKAIVVVFIVARRQIHWFWLRL